MLPRNFKSCLLIIIFILEVAATKASFSATCNVVRPESSTVTLAGTFYAGNDMPIGSVIFNTLAKEVSTSGIECSGEVSVYPYDSVMTEPLGPPSQMNGTPFIGGDVYPTNVKGVGVVLYNLNTSFTTAKPFRYPSPYVTAGIGGSVAQQHGVFIALVKTGPITSGSSVNGASIPQIAVIVPAQGGHKGLPVTLWTVSFTGSLNFITQTCDASDYSVQMGKYDAKENFRGEGTFTAWKDSSILLKNCPKFSGYHDMNTGQSVTGTGVSSGNSRTNNIMKISLQPLSDIIDQDKGLIKVTASNGSTPATGVSLQLGYSENVNATPTNPTMIWKNNVSWSVSAPNDGSSTIKIPLAARYYQTDKKITPGRADGKVMFTISYE